MHKSRIHAEFMQQHNFLVEEEQRQLQRLEKEEREHLRMLGEMEADLAQQSQALQELISELEHRSQGSALELLQVSPGWRSRERPKGKLGNYHQLKGKCGICNSLRKHKLGFGSMNGLYSVYRRVHIQRSMPCNS